MLKTFQLLLVLRVLLVFVIRAATIPLASMDAEWFIVSMASHSGL